jgi:hypothetical protein
LRLIIQFQPSVAISKEQIGLCLLVMKRPDIQIGPAVTVHITPAGSVPLDTGSSRQKPRFSANITKPKRSRHVLRVSDGSGHAEKHRRHNGESDSPISVR